MEAKKFISTLKGMRTRFANKPNEALEKKSVETLTEKFGGKLEAIATLNESGNEDLKKYLKGVLGISCVKCSESEETPAVTTSVESHEETPANEKKTGKVFEVVDGTEYALKDGKVYKLDTIKKTMKRVYKDFKDINVEDINVAAMPMTTYQRYLRDKFPDEDMPIKKGKLHFRGYRISCSIETGFIIEDTTKRYEIVNTPFEGIPTPKELGEWFNKPKVIEHTPEEIREAVERGKELARKATENASDSHDEDEEPDYEALRRKVLRTIKDIRSRTLDFDPMKFPDMIPFKRWKRQVKSLLTQWKDKKIRYKKFIDELEKLTTEETFVVKEKNHRSSFTGTLLPQHKKVGRLLGDKLEVDDKLVDAVPFLLEYLLFYEKRAMSQIMKFAKGEITDVELVKNPLEVDWKVSYNKRALENNEYNARVLSMVYDAVGIVAPQDALYEADLQVGDRILIYIDGEPRVRTIASVDREITLGRDFGMLKSDKWIKLPKKEKK